jgi:hypothetical protein
VYRAELGQRPRYFGVRQLAQAIGRALGVELAQAIDQPARGFRFRHVKLQKNP